MIFPSQLLSDGALHETRQGRENVNRWVYLSVVQLPINKNLTLGNIPSQIRNRVRDI